MTTLCSCCFAAITAPAIATRAGVIFPGLGLCRACWRLVGRAARIAMRRTRLDYQAMPFLAQALALYRAWEAALLQAEARRPMLRWAA